MPEAVIPTTLRRIWTPTLGVLAFAFLPSFLSLERDKTTPSDTTQKQDPAKQPDGEALIAEYCVRCHGGERTRADLDLKTALSEQPLVRNEQLWRDALALIRAGEMPPEDEKQPSRSEREILTDWIETSLQGPIPADQADPGFEPARRLTRAETRNVLRDLCSVDIGPWMDLLPEDLASNGGFTNSANSLFLQESLIEPYLKVSEFVLTEDTVRRLVAEQLVGNKSLDQRTPAEIRRFLRSFLRRAWRRTPNDISLERLGSLHTRALERGDEPVVALTLALRAALASPRFLMKLEAPNDSKDTFAVDAFDLANRLSFFLWASMPDDRLFDLAEDGSLLDATTLEAEVDRMLQDPRSESLGDLFAAEWLGFDALGTRIRPDPIDNPELREPRLRAMRQETAAFVHHTITQGRPLTDLLLSDTSYLNEETAAHYEIEGVKGTSLRAVHVGESGRGGILGHASVLLVTSNPWRTNPIRRGTFILTELLGRPPAPPPPDAGELDEDLAEDEDLSFRELLELHRRKKSCSVCHDDIDPLGLALEGFDHHGRRREIEDLGGRLPSGTELTGLRDLQAAIATEYRDDYERQVASKLLSYALGRSLVFGDRPAIDELAARMRTEGRNFRVLIRAITESLPFRYKKYRDAEPARDR